MKEGRVECFDDVTSPYIFSSREKVNVLLVDDDVEDITLIKQLSVKSKQLAFSITTCRSTDEAEAILVEADFDLVYVDYWLGSGTSIGFICDFVQSRGSPCILLTSLDEPDIRRLAFRAGAEAFLAKEDLSTQALESAALTVLRARAMTRPRVAS